MKKQYKICLFVGSLIDNACITDLPQHIIKPANDNWGNLIELEVDLDKIKEIQKNMVKHYSDPVPWYLDGQLIDDEKQRICAFGADDGQGGRIFKFNKKDLDKYQEVIDYGLSVGIPLKEIDFLKLKD
ncbi:hypothetical protein ACFL2U_01915 [Patescibacteria group bacterium]